MGFEAMYNKRRHCLALTSACVAPGERDPGPRSLSSAALDGTSKAAACCQELKSRLAEGSRRQGQAASLRSRGTAGERCFQPWKVGGCSGHGWAALLAVPKGSLRSCPGGLGQHPALPAVPLSRRRGGDASPPLSGAASLRGQTVLPSGR